MSNNNCCYFGTNTYTLIESDPEDEHHLRGCIAAGRHIDFDEAMKSFNQEPQYNPF